MSAESKIAIKFCRHCGEELRAVEGEPREFCSNDCRLNLISTLSWILYTKATVRRRMNDKQFDRHMEKIGKLTAELVELAERKGP